MRYLFLLRHAALSACITTAVCIAALPAMADVLRPEPPFLLSITPSQAEQLMQAEQDLLVVDTRTVGEQRRGVIEGSKLVSFWSVVRGKYQPPRDRPLLLVCAVGGRSYGVGQLLRTKGYERLYNLKGGLRDWAASGRPLVMPSPQDLPR